MTTLSPGYGQGQLTSSAAEHPQDYKVALLLIGSAFAVDLLTPFLISNGFLPGPIRFLSDLLLLSIIGLSLLQMLLQDRIPAAVFLIIAVSVIGSIVATFSGQGWAATAWGWWRLFKFPIAAVFVYIQPYWPVSFAARMMRLCVAILTVNTGLQILQYLAGEIPGDHLSGTFGRFGVAPLFFFISFVSALAFGRWLVTGDWKLLIWVLAMAMISSLLGEMKAYTIVIAVFAALTFAIQAVRGGKIRELFTYVSLFIVGALLFAFLYNNLVADPRGTRRIQEYFDSDTTSTYLGNVRYDSNSGVYSLGRNSSLLLTWDLLQRDSTLFLFGMGIGARSESRSLGIAGVGVQDSYYGAASIPTLSVFLQELGIIGLGLFGIVILTIIIMLVNALPVWQDTEIRTLIFGLILFSLIWPFWLWYTQVWIHSVGMLLYWCSVAYVLNITNTRRAAADTAPSPRIQTTSDELLLES